MPYLTPDTIPAETICRALYIPDDPDLIACVTGALLELTYEHNWEAFGAKTPAETAAAMRDMCDNFSLVPGSCRMVGEIVPFAGANSPDPAWLLCDGASLVRADYPDLFTVIGTTYGAADGTHFNIPDLRGRSPIGAGQGSGLTNRALAANVGAETHTLVTGEIPSHNHPDSGHVHGYNSAAAGITSIAPGVPTPTAYSFPFTTAVGYAAPAAAGSDQAHNNMQPSLAINFFIVAE